MRLESNGAEICGTTEYVQRRTRHQNLRFLPLDYGQAPEAAYVLSASEKFQIDHFLPNIDQFTTELTKRLAQHHTFIRTTLLKVWFSI